jgi:transposase-like protein
VFIDISKKNGELEIFPWQKRPPDEVWSFVYLDAIRAKVRQDNSAPIVGEAEYHIVQIE